MDAIAIFGATGIGKTDLVIQLAKDIGEIVNLDSMQIYQYMNIGTAKPSLAQRALVPHHLVDIYSPLDTTNAADIVQKALTCIHSIQQRNKIPFVTGGTGLYFKSLFQGMFQGPSRSDSMREQIEKEIEEQGVETILETLRYIDPTVSKHLTPNDTRRIIRALEVYRLTGIPLSEHWKKAPAPTVQFVKIGVMMDRDLMYRRINQRCEQMLEEGFLEEVKQLIAMGVTIHHTAMQAIGYRHLYRYLTEASIPLGQTVEWFKRDTRRFAKRQMTLFRALPEVPWFPIDAIEAIQAYLQTHLSSILE